MATTHALLTAEEFFRLADLGQPSELVIGASVPCEIPGCRHGYVCTQLAFQLGEFVDRDKQGLVFLRSGVVTSRNPDTVRGADVAYYSYQRLPKGALPDGYPSVAPELVCEVRSPTDRWPDVLAKVAEYLSAGVTTVVVVDPESEQVVVHESDRASATLGRAQTLSLPRVLPGLSIAVERLFS